LISASFAAGVLDQRLASGALRSADLAEYEQRWRTRLGPELDAQMALRQVANGLSDGAIEDLFELARTDGIMPIVRSTARFNRHRDFIVSLLKHPPARRVLFRRVWRSA
jgi:flavin-dependent dehydrogenase